jgi:hypothetical protein
MLRATSTGSWVAKGKKVILNKARETIGYHERIFDGADLTAPGPYPHRPSSWRFVHLGPHARGG